MKKINYILLIIFCIVSVMANAQTRVAIKLDSTIQAVYSQYTPPLRAAMWYTDTIGATNATPEILMSSILSASNQPWVNYNTKGGAERADQKTEQHFREVLARDREKNFFELYSKLEFELDQRQMAIVKFYLHLVENEKTLAGTTVMERSASGKWQVVTEPRLTPLAMSLMIFKNEVFENFVTNTPENAMEESVLDGAYTQNKALDVLALIQRNFSEEEKAALTNPLNW